MRLVVTKGANSGQVIPVSQLVELGRDPSCGILLQDERVSQRHARLESHGNAWVVTDLGSTNGTWVNRERLGGPYTLRDGDELGVGRTVMKVELLTTSSPLVAPAPVPYGAPALYGGSAPLATTPFGYWLSRGGAIVGALLLIGGSFAAWVRLQVLFIEQILSGMDILGPFPMLAGVLVMGGVLLELYMRWAAARDAVDRKTLVGYARAELWSRVGLGVSLLTAAGWAWWRYQQASDTEVLWGITAGDMVTSTLASGAYVSLAGALLLIASGIIGLLQHDV